MKVPAKTRTLGVLRDVDEAAGAREPLAEAADVDVALRVALREAQAGEVEAAAVVEVELLVLVQHGGRVQGGAEIEPALRQAADHPGLGGERQVFQHPLLGGHRRDPLGHADAEIDHAPRRKLEGAAPGDDLAGIERHRGDPVERDALAAREGVVVGRAVGLAVVLRLAQHHAIHQHAGHLHLARVERAGLGQPLHLRDDEAARVLRRHGGREVVEGESLALHGDVAGGIRRRAADQRDVHREGLVVQPGLAAELDHADEILPGHGIELAALEPRIHEGAQTHLGDVARRVRGDLPVEVRDHAERQVVGLDPPLDRHGAELRHERPVAADDALDEARDRQPVEAALLAVARRGGEHQAEPVGPSAGS